jgi:putative CocE/NonD family hydrolase
MVDGWRGDDWFHNGAFRNTNLEYIAGQNSARGKGEEIVTGTYDDYDAFLRAGSTADFAHLYGVDQLNFTKKLFEHPAYDSYWQEQALDRILAKRPLSVPTMTVVGRWDQEDIYGAYATYAAVEPKDKDNSMNSLVVGPWRHSGVNYEGSSLGALKFTGDTAGEFRREVMLPFFNQYLKDGAPKFDTPPVWSYQTGVNRWRRLEQWPLVPSTTPIYLKAGLALGFDKSDNKGAAFDEYVSDPMKPVPFVPRPVRMSEGTVWKPWLVTDQRSYSDRPDVLTYVSAPLAEPLELAGQPMVKLFASTSGTDSDWVVKLIDVYPNDVPEGAAQGGKPSMAGYEMPIGIEIFRGRYLKSFAQPAALKPGKVEHFHWTLPNVDHVFLPGHRIMVQVQSSLFPLYDRNPQTYVDNIMYAKPGDYKKATQSIWYGGGNASAVVLPVAP